MVLKTVFTITWIYSWWFSPRHAITLPYISTFCFFLYSLTILETITLVMEIVSQSSYFKKFSIMLIKYLETCQNLVATSHIYLINRPRINVLFQTCV